jgi:amidohydrolase
MQQLELEGEARALLPDLIALRRAIHSEPELGLYTPKTMVKVRDALADLPLEWLRGTSTSGEVAVLKGAAPGRSVLLRGDMDALPLVEETGLNFSSQIQGAMHACGHDAHTAMLVGAARLLTRRRHELAGDVMFMFQPGEEGHHGARFMLDDGLINPLPDAAFALHVMPNGEHGVFGGRKGALLASSDKLTIIVKGAGGHASMPHYATDPVPIACEIVGAIQAMVTRQISVFDPVVVTIAEIKAGTTDNIIPETARLHGTIRTLSLEQRGSIQQRISTLAQHIAQAHGATADVSFVAGFPVTICDPRAVALGEDAAVAMFGADCWRTMENPIMGAEDFSYVLQKVPGAMFFLGAAHAGSDWSACCGLHSNHMVIDEDIMPKGAALLAELARRFLADGFTS